MEVLLNYPLHHQIIDCAICLQIMFHAIKLYIALFNISYIKFCVIVPSKTLLFQYVVVPLSHCTIQCIFVLIHHIIHTFENALHHQNTHHPDIQDSIHPKYY